MREIFNKTHTYFTKTLYKHDGLLVIVPCLLSIIFTGCSNLAVNNENYFATGTIFDSSIFNGASAHAVKTPLFIEIIGGGTFVILSLLVIASRILANNELKRIYKKKYINIKRIIVLKIIAISSVLVVTTLFGGIAVWLAPFEGALSSLLTITQTTVLVAASIFAFLRIGENSKALGYEFNIYGSTPKILKTIGKLFFANKLNIQIGKSDKVKEEKENE